MFSNCVMISSNEGWLPHSVAKQCFIDSRIDERTNSGIVIVLHL
jgi:hypothetical protein